MLALSLAKLVSSAAPGANVSDLHLRPIGNSLWRAGAGAGKTYNLVQRVMRIAEDWSKTHDGAFPRLVVTTFTRMATQELRVRLMEAALKAAAEGKKDLIPFVTSRSQLFVTTLHGVMDSFLRSFGSEIGLEPGFRVAGSEEMEALVRRVGKKILFPDATTTQTVVDELLNEFDFSTTLRLLQRVSRIRTEFDETEKPARPANRTDMLASMALSLRDLADDLKSLHDEIARGSDDPKWAPHLEWLQLVVREMKVESFDETHLDMLIELLAGEPKIVNSTKSKHYIAFAAGEDWKDPIKNAKSELANLLVELTAIEKFEKVNAALDSVERQFSEALRREKLRAGLIELEDLELLALELIRRSPKAAETYAASWDHWLIDEYQDTSPRQVVLLAALAKGRPQFVVGDPQQSIYLFRGARPNVFLDREDQASSEAHEKVELMGNRRSHPEVMAFINHSVAKLGSDFQEMTAERRHQHGDGRRPGSVASPFGAATLLSMAPATFTDASGKTKPLKIEDLRRLEAEQISNVVATLLHGDPKRNRPGASPASIAILARSNKDLGIVAREFARRGLPFQIHTAGAYSDRLEVADLCALLSFLSNPHDDENLIHLARTAWFPIREEVLATGYRRTGSLWNVLEAERAKDVDENHEIEALQAGLIAARERGLVQAFREMLMGCDFFSWCGVLDPSGRREANALKFLAKLAVAERQAGFVPRRFVDEILGGGDRGSENESNDRDAVAAVKPDRIHLMTIHVSKGLEFDHVFLPFLADAGGKGRSSSEFILHEQKRVWSVGLSVDDEGGSSAGPLAREWNDILHTWGVEEMKRLLYVALTRARESLFLSVTGEPKTNSFLSFLDLSREPGDHGTYRTIVDTGAAGAGGVALSAGKSEGNLRAPWGQVPRARPDSVYAGISVTRLLELEDEIAAQNAISREGAGGARGARIQRSTPAPGAARRSLSMAIAAARGTRLHRVFEMAKPDRNRDQNENQTAMAQEIARWFVEDEQEGARDALKWLLALKEPNLASVLSSGEVEWSFTYVRGGYAVDGQIDLWGRDPAGRLWVIDYKTGDSFYKDKAIRQLKYYAEALLAGRVAQAEEEVFLCALYPFTKEIFTESMVLPKGL